MNNEKKLDIINRLEKVNEMLTHGVVLYSIIAAFVQLVIMVTE